MIELYHHGSSVCSAKVRFVLMEKGLAWTGHYLDILAGEHFQPEYLKLNPNAVVPTLIHDGEVLIEFDDNLRIPRRSLFRATGQAKVRFGSRPDEAVD